MRMATVVLLWVFLVTAVQAAGISPSYEEIWQNNPFSPNRTYVPPSENNGSHEDVKQEEIKKNLLLRGTYRVGDHAYALFEVKSPLRNKWQMDKDQQFLLVSLGEEVGDCILEKIQRGEVLLGGSCGELILSLADLPERHNPIQPLPKSGEKPVQPKLTSQKPAPKKIKPPRSFSRDKAPGNFVEMIKKHLQKRK